MARIFKDIAGVEYNLDAILQSANISFDEDIDILDGSTVRCYVKCIYLDGLTAKEDRIIVSKEYQEAIKKIVQK